MSGHAVVHLVPSPEARGVDLLRAGPTGGPRDPKGRPLEALLAVINAAAGWVAEGLGPPERIDALVRVEPAPPLGPLALADQLGIDVCVEAMERLHAATGSPGHRPCPLLRHMVRAGLVGCRAGRGFYDYAGCEALERLGQTA